MIKVKLNNLGDNVHIVDEGETVRYDPENVDVLEVLNVDEEVIAVFRGWIYARPVIDEDYDEDEGDDEDIVRVDDVMIPELLLQHLQTPELEPAVVVEAEVHETASPGQMNSHGAYGLADDETEDPAE